MKRLYLLRHAKSSWKYPELSDDQRPLNSRGKRNAPDMAERFLNRGDAVDRIVSSPATRALSTAMAFAAVQGWSRQDIIESSKLYFRGLTAFSSVIRDQGTTANRLLLVSHNPDLTEFANRLDPQLVIGNLPTCGLICLDCSIDDWRQWSPERCRFVYYDYPKNPTESVITHPVID